MNNLTNRYSTLASWVYHLDKPIGRSFGDIEYYYERLKDIKGPILEAAVGNGRILLPLLEKGLNVFGFDASTEMLNYCKEELRKRSLNTTLQLKRFDDFSFEQKFEAIIIPAGSFQLITDVNEAIEVLKRFKNALNEGGRLILDLSPLSALAEPTMNARQWNIEKGLLTLTESRVEVDYINQKTISQLRYEHWTNDEGLIQTELDLFALRFWGVKEFELALKLAGFTTISCSSNYKYAQALDSETHTITFEAI
ncbi:class I SAM-dependent methyltransferase [Myroides injenensis]|uniref:class I SAM-dependent methyltransferase n=1 Tax=Myroides injenensis TaxID=1183151 RepID=UPI000289792C|nr:class I SAM-dependent methyltransferase [Myroides injenensis]